MVVEDERERIVEWRLAAGDRVGIEEITLRGVFAIVGCESSSVLGDGESSSAGTAEASRADGFPDGS